MYNHFSALILLKGDGFKFLAKFAILPQNANSPKMLASMARVSEAELVYAIKHTGELHGVKIPEPMQARGNAKTRNFDYLQCVAFVEELEKARVNENVRKSVGKGK